jgi:hypothetical protein
MFIDFLNSYFTSMSHDDKIVELNSDTYLKLKDIEVYIRSKEYDNKCSRAVELIKSLK